MSTLHSDVPPSKPVALTIAALLLAIPLQPFLGLDLIYDIAAFWFVASKWRDYHASARHIAALMQAAPASASPERLRYESAIAYFNKGNEAYNAGDYPTAVKWFARAAQEGDEDAMNSLSVMYRKGQGIPVDVTRAAQWCEKAIAQGEREYAPGNMNTIGAMYMKGESVAKDVGEAMRLYRIAADCGYHLAQENLGGCYRYGLSGTKDSTLARHWYGLAAAQGSASAKQALAELDAEAQEQSGSSAGGRMTRAAALEILDLKEGATAAQIRAAYTRLMQHVHPDKGGSTFFAKQLNEARDLLLK